MSLLPFKRRLQPGIKPRGLYEINKKHPLSKGLYSCLLFDKKPEYSLIRNEIGWGNASVSLKVSGGELGARFASVSTSDANYLYDADFGAFTNNIKGSYSFGPGTLAFGFVCDDVTPPDELGVIAWGATNGTGGLYIYIVGGYLKVACGAWSSPTTIHAITAGKKYRCTFKMDSSANGVLWVDGVKIEERAFTLSPNSSSQRCEIGRIFEGEYGNSLNGVMTHVYFYDHDLNDTGCKALSIDPYQILKLVNDPVYFIPDVGGDPIAVNDAYDVIDGVQLVVSAELGILINDTYGCT